MARRCEGTPFYDEYIRRVAEIGALPAAKFVKDLRNYMLHQSLPAPYSRVDLSPQKVTYKLQISVPALRVAGCHARHTGHAANMRMRQ